MPQAERSSGKVGQFRVRKRAGRPHGTTRRERVGLVEAGKTRGKLLLSPASCAARRSRKWKEIRKNHVGNDDTAGAERFGRGAGKPAGDDGHRNGYLLRDAHSSAATTAQEAASDAGGVEGGRQSDHQWRHLWSYQWHRRRHGDPENRRHRFVSGKNSHRAFGNYAGGGIGRCEISPPAFR